jgi:putative hydrolase of HD superfamily
MNDPLDFLRDLAALKDLPRAGWTRRGLVGAESVGDHTFLAAVLALVMGESLGVDAGRLLRLVLVHDMPECDPAVGDLTPFCGVPPAEKRARERAAMARLCAKIEGGERLLALWEEYDAGETPEAALAHEIDGLEMALQARIYEDRLGVDLSEFIDGARRKVRHPVLVKLLDAIDGRGTEPAESPGEAAAPAD